MNPFHSLVRELRRWIVLGVNPLKFRQEMVRRSSSASLEDKIAYDVLPRPHFSYGVYQAAQQAKALGIDRISALEFGCAGGNGLVELEHTAKLVGLSTDVQVDVFGFDIGEGLPRPLDYRDLPYAWQAGQFKMDVPKLQSKLTSAQLVIGDVGETVVPFRSRADLAPIGFISFDLDFYTSTKAAFTVFDGGFDHLLPRVYSYFDDCIGPDNELHSEFAGELLAINEFNEEHENFKLAPINGLHHKRLFPSPWNDAMFVMHAFNHPLYGKYIQPKVDMALALEK